MRWKRHHVQIKESVLTILCEARCARTAEKAVRCARSVVEKYIAQHADFALSFVPTPVEDDAHEIIRKMALAARAMNVGPMAAVAGAIAEYTLGAIIDDGAGEAVVDNGGDIALKVVEPVVIGIYAGGSPVKDVAFYIEPTPEAMSICTSSGTVGHSFSYGKADAAVVISADASLADAAATALGNRIKKPADLGSAFEFLTEHLEVTGALAICRGQIGLFGKLPRMIKAHVDDGLITRGKGYAKNKLCGHGSNGCSGTAFSETPGGSSDL